MSKLQRKAFGMAGFAQAMGMIANYDPLWRAAMIDSADGKQVINADGTLRHEDFKKIIEEVVEVRRRSLNGIADLIAARLTRQEALTTQLVGYENINEFQAAKRDMNPTNYQDNNTDFAEAFIPLPITHQSWSIPWRQNGFAYKNQLGLTESVRQVGESLEDMLFNGASDIRVSVAGGTPVQIYGYANHPNRVQVAISDWSDLATNATKIVPETIAMIRQAFKTNASARPDSIMMYVGNDIWSSLQEDYSSAKGDRTFIERLKAIVEIADVKPAEKLSAKDVVLVEMERRSVELAIASDVVTVPHQRMGAMDDQVFTTYAAMVPIIKVDRNNRTGIVHGVEAL